jgi:hypothetical protein
LFFKKKVTILLLFSLMLQIHVYADEKTTIVDPVQKSNEGIYASLQVGSNDVQINGELKKINNAPFVENDFTYVPLRELVELFGGIVKYIPDDQSVMIALTKQCDSGQAYFSQMWIGTNRVVNNKDDESAVHYWMYSVGKLENYHTIIRDGRVYVPANYFERFGFASVWNSTNDTIIIKSQAADQGKFRYLIESTQTCDKQYFYVNYESMLVIEKDGKLGLMDKTGNSVALPNGVLTFSGLNVAWFRENEKYGLVDTSGHVVLTPKYDNASDFSEGLAEVTKDGKAGYVDITGKEVVPLIYDHDIRNHSFCGEIAVVCKDYKYGFVDKTGKELIAPQYDYCYNDYDDSCFVVRKEKIWSIVDNTGKEMMLPQQYDYIDSFENGFALVHKDDKTGMIDKTGKEIVLPGHYDRIFNVSGGFAKVSEKGKIGFIDTTGREVVTPQYDYASDFSEGAAVVRKDGKWRLIDATGKEFAFVANNYDEVASFSNGLAQVYKDGKCGLIDMEGREVLSPIYYSISEFKNGLSVVTYNGFVSGLINTKAEFVAPLSFDKIAICDSETAFALKDGHMDIISVNGTKDIIRGAD